MYYRLLTSSEPQTTSRADSVTLSLRLLASSSARDGGRCFSCGRESLPSGSRNLSRLCGRLHDSRCTLSQGSEAVNATPSLVSRLAFSRMRAAGLIQAQISSPDARLNHTVTLVTSADTPSCLSAPSRRRSASAVIRLSKLGFVFSKLSDKHQS